MILDSQTVVKIVKKIYGIIYQLQFRLFRSAETIVEDDFDFVSDPIETAGLFEGDIADVTMDDLRKLRSGDYSKNAIRELWKKWPDATIPYEISSQFGSYERSVIAKAMKTYHKKTCIK